MSFKNLPASIVSILIFAALVLPVLGTSEVFQVSEAREGVVVEEILQSGDWILPLRNGTFVPSKPPLFHWICAVLSYPFARFDEFWLRLPSFLAALGVLLTIASFVTKRHSPLAGAFAAGMLGSTYGFVRLATDGRVDMLFCFFYTAATLKAFGMLLDAKQNEPKPYLQRDILLFALLCGLAAFTKGPLGIVLPFATFGLSHLLLRGWRSCRDLLRWELLIAPLIPLPWYLAAYQRGKSSFFERQIVFENFARFFGGEGIAEKDSWFYFPHIFAEAAPWSIFFVLYLFFLARESFKRRSVTSNRFLPAETEAARLIVLGLIWFGTVLAFLTLAAGKRRAYLLLGLPSIAIVLSVRFASTYLRMSREGKAQALAKKLQYETLTWGLLVWFIGVLPGLVPIFIGPHEAKVLDAIVPRSAEFFSGLEYALIRGEYVFPILFSVLAGGSVALWILGHRGRNLGFLAWAIYLFVQLSIVFYVQVFMTLKGHTHTYKRFALRMATTVPRDVPVTLVKKDADESFDGLSFYFKRHMPLLDPDGDFQAKKLKPLGLFLARRGWLNENKLGATEEIFSGGRLVDKPDDELVLFNLK